MKELVFTQNKTGSMKRILAHQKPVTAVEAQPSKAAHCIQSFQQRAAS